MPRGVVIADEFWVYGTDCWDSVKLASTTTACVAFDPYLIPAGLRDFSGYFYYDKICII